ncbi:MAG: RES family NAD+ phosphorylase [Acidimicrobiales bacterium]
MPVVAYRHAAYDSPWWAYPSSREGRFHRAGRDTVQYLCLHPLGPAAEMLRHNVGPAGNPDDVVLNLWVARLEVHDVVHISFDDCAAYGLTPDELVADDYGPTQALADRMRAAGSLGLIVPSAALPGTDNLVLFGIRVLHPYLWVPLTAEEIQTGHLSDGARPPREAASLVRWFGDPHPSLEQWKSTGSYEPLDDPAARGSDGR